MQEFRPLSGSLLRGGAQPLAIQTRDHFSAHDDDGPLYFWRYSALNSNRNPGHRSRIRTSATHGDQFL
jgi:hypothetical protein